jgi:hypothetical protein
VICHPINNPLFPCGREVGEKGITQIFQKITPSRMPNPQVGFGFLKYKIPLMDFVS